LDVAPTPAPSRCVPRSDMESKVGEPPPIPLGGAPGE